MESSIELITYSLNLIFDIDIPVSMEMRAGFFFIFFFSQELAETASLPISSGLRQPSEQFEGWFS